MNILFFTLGLYFANHTEIRAFADIEKKLQQGAAVKALDIGPTSKDNIDDAAQLNELNRQQDIIDVTTFGIMPNDNVDDAAKLNTLIKKTPSGTLYFPAGDYLLASPVTLKSNISLKGAGVEIVTFTQAGSVMKWMSFREQGVITTNGNLLNENVHVSDIALRGIYRIPADGKSVSAKGGICMVNCKNSSVTAVTTYDTWHGVAFYNYPLKGGNSGNAIRGVKVYRAKSFSMPGNSGRPRGILMSTPGGVVENCLTSNCGTGYFASGNDISLVGCRAEEWTIDNGFYIIVNNCRIERCEATTGSKSKQGPGSGFVIAYSKGGVIQDCVAINCSNYGFRIHVPQSDLQLTNNKAERCGIGFGIENASHQYPEMCKNLLFCNNVSAYCNLQGFLFRQLKI